MGTVAETLATIHLLHSRNLVLRCAFVSTSHERLLQKNGGAYMDHGLRIIRAAMAGTTLALCVTCVLIAACAIRVKPFDFPAMKLTEPAASENANLK
jgi:hypothetical protein